MGLAVLGLGSGEEERFSYQLETLVTSMSITMNLPWMFLNMASEGFNTGAIADVEVDMTKEIEISRKLMFALVKAMRLEETFYMMYFGLEDGTFMGYYGMDQKGGASSQYVFTYLPGWDCAWNYTAACGSGAGQPPRGVPCDGRGWFELSRRESDELTWSRRGRLSLKTRDDVERGPSPTSLSENVVSHLSGHHRVGYEAKTDETP